MAASPATIATLVAHLNIKFSGANARQYRKHYPFLRVVPKRQVQSDGKAGGPVEFERGDAAGSSFHTPGDDYPDEKSVKRKLAQWDIAEVALTAGYTDLAKGIASNNRLPSRQDFRASEIHGTVHAALKDLNASCYTGDYTASPPELAGLETAGGSAAFGGIDPGVSGYEAWEGQNDTETLSNFNDDPVGVMRAYLDAIRDEGGSADFAFAKSGIITTLLNAQQGADSQVRVRLYDGVDYPITEIGARAVVVDNCWFIDDPAAQANKVNVISSESIEYQYVAQEMPSPDEIAAALTGMIGADGSRISLEPSVVEQLLAREMQLPPFYFTALAKTATKDRIGIAHQGQLTYTQRRHHGVLSLTT